MAMDEKIWPSHKVCDYTFNFHGHVMSFAIDYLLALVLGN
jgi:hypothetical protein